MAHFLFFFSCDTCTTSSDGDVSGVFTVSCLPSFSLPSPVSWPTSSRPEAFSWSRTMIAILPSFYLSPFRKKKNIALINLTLLSLCFIYKLPFANTLLALFVSHGKVLHLILIFEKFLPHLRRIQSNYINTGWFLL